MNANIIQQWSKEPTLCQMNILGLNLKRNYLET